MVTRLFGGLFGFLALLVCFCNGFKTLGNTFAVGLDLFFVAVAKLYRSATIIIRFAQQSLQIAFVAPVDKLEVAPIDDEPWRSGIGLNHIAEFGVRVFETGRWMFLDGLL